MFPLTPVLVLGVGRVENFFLLTPCRSWSDLPAGAVSRRYFRLRRSCGAFRLTRPSVCRFFGAPSPPGPGPPGVPVCCFGFLVSAPVLGRRPIAVGPPSAWGGLLSSLFQIPVFRFAVVFRLYLRIGRSYGPVCGDFFRSGWSVWTLRSRRGPAGPTSWGPIILFSFFLFSFYVRSDQELRSVCL